MKRVLALAALLFAFNAHATTYYFIDCQTGADAACAGNEGVDTNSGLTPTTAFKTYAKLSGKTGAGNTILFARGGKWTSAAIIFSGINTLAGAVGNPVNVGTFTPSWCTGACTTARPILESTFNSSGNPACVSWTAAHDIVITGIKFLGVGVTSGSGCINLYKGVKRITFDDIEVSGFSIALSQNNDNPADPSTEITLRNSYIHDNGAQGFLGGGDRLLLEGNTFDNNGGYSPSFQWYRNHNVYISATPFNKVQRTVVRGNTFTRASVDSGVCKGASLVVHNTSIDLVIENNTFDESTGVSGGCYGIDITPGNTGQGDAEYYTHTTIRGNKLINMGSNAIHLQACDYCVIENNMIVWENSPTLTVLGIGIDPTTGPQAAEGDPISTNLTIRNNSVYINGNNSFNVGISINSDGSGHRVANNLIYFASGTSAAAKCYVTQTIGNYATWDNNLCYRVGGVNTYSNRYATLLLAQGALADTNGSVSDPSLTAAPGSGNGYTIGFTAGPAKNAGMTSLCPKLAYGGLVRVGACDIGATHQGATVLAPSSPTP